MMFISHKVRGFKPLFSSILCTMKTLAKCRKIIFQELGKLARDFFFFCADRCLVINTSSHGCLVWEKHSHQNNLPGP